MPVAVVIPAYNEEKTVGNILRLLKSIEFIDEIILVSDGSTDNTASIGKSCGVRVIELTQNSGKVSAVMHGVKSTDADVILLLDADLIGLKREHVSDLLRPVLEEDADMTVGIFKNGRGATDLAQKIAPFLSGQRAVQRRVFDKLDGYGIKDYGLEMALTILAKRENLKVQPVILKDLTHVMKEEKRGLIMGGLARMKMYWDILFCILKLKLEVF
ncbi:glycosyltransferase family 2 protein [Thermosediminibacter litoriperuensis]|uniref:Glucosyl-3-phosphoglycerate synthase n=1 Tax=Thermosediminibacter litoriperuensis TaxID=291989 RepID=A0A5S5AQJ2_9FIRM|nr:glycosyltransferase family 2 protein [Thermosediminibacter litoriperuensis]TYP54287.1 glycosyltransferase involved in cell wall biosynthesis [Thermosediminibacter litoriperuensis]